MPEETSTPYKRVISEDAEDNEHRPMKKCLGHVGCDFMEEDDMDEASQGMMPEESSDNMDNADKSHTSTTHKSVPYPGEFTVNDICFGPLAKESFRTGKITLTSQSEILKPLYNKIIMYSNDPQ
jgi:hypothetical protein